MAVKMVNKIKPVPTYTAGKAPTGYAPGGVATKKVPTAKPTSYAAAVKAFKPSAATIKAIAPTQAAKNALGPAWGGQYAAGSQPIPQYLMPATVPTTAGTATAPPRSSVPSNYDFNLAAIQENPLSQQALGQYNTDMQSLMRALQTNLGQKLISSGYDPTAAFQKLLADRPDLGEFADLLRPSDIAAAAANPLSERALAQQTYDRGALDQVYQLAARGMGGSGEAAVGTNQLLQNRQLSENASRDALLQAITGGITDYLGQKRTGYEGVMDTYAKVAELLAQQEGGPYPEGDEDVTDVENAAAVAGQGGLIPGTNIPNATMPTNYLNWFGTQIRSVDQMQAELKKRGMSWNVWAGQHPNQARLLTDLS